MNLDEKINKIVDLLGICDKCYSGFMKERHNNISNASVLDTYNISLEFKCDNCDYLMYLPNPNYVSQEERQKAKYIHQTSNDNIEEIMENFSF